jgi:DNA modification methylase
MMGSGTTGVACVKMKRNFVGIEKVRQYYNDSKKRIREEENKLKLF